jgi:cytochrome c5
MTRISLFCLFLGCLYCVVETTAQTGQPQGKEQRQPQAQEQQIKSSAKGSQAASETSEGEKRFEANCGRCHTPPEDISPREARAIVRQMRVRAMLSAEDEQLILKYIAP